LTIVPDGVVDSLTLYKDSLRADRSMAFIRARSACTDAALPPKVACANPQIIINDSSVPALGYVTRIFIAPSLRNAETLNVDG
jgi:hypothetical protein